MRPRASNINAGMGYKYRENLEFPVGLSGTASHGVTFQSTTVESIRVSIRRPAHARWVFSSRAMIWQIVTIRRVPQTDSGRRGEFPEFLHELTGPRSRGYTTREEERTFYGETSSGVRPRNSRRDEMRVETLVDHASRFRTINTVACTQ